jgi:hypothetical protein
MPKFLADENHVASVELFLEHAGIDHLHVRKRGDLVVLESGPASDRVPRARLRRDTVHLWTLEFATHSGRWEKTGFRDQLRSLLTLVTTIFPWTIAPLD